METSKRTINLAPTAIVPLTALIYAVLAFGQASQQAAPRTNDQASAAAGDKQAAAIPADGTAASTPTAPAAAPPALNRSPIRSNVRRTPNRRNITSSTENLNASAASERKDGSGALGGRNQAPAANDRNAAHAAGNRGIGQNAGEQSAVSAAAGNSTAQGAGDIGSIPKATTSEIVPAAANAATLPSMTNSVAAPASTVSRAEAGVSGNGNANTGPEQQVTHAELVPQGPDYSLFKAAGGLGLVLSLIALGYFGGKKFFPKHFARSVSDKKLKLIETLSMGEKRSISIIELDDQRFLVGNTPNQITLLAAISSREPLPDSTQPATAPSFELAKSNVASDTFRNLYEVEKDNGRRPRKPIPPDIRAKMRQLRESLDR